MAIGYPECRSLRLNISTGNLELERAGNRREIIHSCLHQVVSHFRATLGKTWRPTRPPTKEKNTERTTEESICMICIICDQDY